VIRLFRLYLKDMNFISCNVMSSDIFLNREKNAEECDATGA